MQKAALFYQALQFLGPRISGSHAIDDSTGSKSRASPQDLRTSGGREGVRPPLHQPLALSFSGNYDTGAIGEEWWPQQRPLLKLKTGPSRPFIVRRLFGGRPFQSHHGAGPTTFPASLRAKARPKRCGPAGAPGEVLRPQTTGYGRSTSKLPVLSERTLFCFLDGGLAGANLSLNAGRHAAPGTLVSTIFAVARQSLWGTC